MKIVFIGENPTVRRLVELSAAKAGMMVEMAMWNDCDLSTANFVVVEYEALGEDGISILSFVPAGIKRIAVMPRDQEVPDVFDVSIRKPFLPTELVDLFLSNAPIESPTHESKDDDHHEVLHDDDLDINLDELDDMVHGLHDEMVAHTDNESDELEKSTSDEINLDFEELTDTDDIDFGDSLTLDNENDSFVSSEAVELEDVSSIEENNELAMPLDEGDSSDDIDFGDSLTLDDENDSFVSSEAVESEDVSSIEENDELATPLDEGTSSGEIDFTDDMKEEEKTTSDSIFDEPFTDEMDQLLGDAEVVTVDDQQESMTEDFDSYLDDAIDEKSDDKKEDDSVLDMNDIAQLKDLLADEDDFDSLDEREMRMALGEDIEELDEINEDAHNAECNEKEVEVCNESLSKTNEMTPSVTAANPAELLSLLSTLSSQKLREVLDGATITVSITYPKNGDTE